MEKENKTENKTNNLKYEHYKEMKILYGELYLDCNNEMSIFEAQKVNCYEFYLKYKYFKKKMIKS